MSVQTDTAARLLERIKELQEKEDDFLARAKQEAATKQQLISALQEGIVAGAMTTGDHVQDLTIRAHGLEFELMEKLREFDNQLKGKQGEFLLILYSVELDLVRGGPGGPRRSHTSHLYRLGVLEKEELIYVAEEVGARSREYITFPVTNFIHGYQSDLIRRNNVPHRLHKGNIFSQGPWDSRPPTLTEHLTPQRGSFSPLLPTASITDILIGNEKAKEWAEKYAGKDRGDTFIKAANKALSVLVLEPTTEDES